MAVFACSCANAWRRRTGETGVLEKSLADRVITAALRPLIYVNHPAASDTYPALGGSVDLVGELQRERLLRHLATSAIAGASPFALNVEARHAISTSLASEVCLELDGGKRCGTEEGSSCGEEWGNARWWFAVPIGEPGRRRGKIVVSSQSPRRYTTSDVAFVREVADLLDRVGAIHRDFESLRYLAYHDPLTGLPNRAALDARLAEAKADGTPISLLVCDVDALKAVNDELGHAYGDELLVITAARIRDALHHGDLVARTGGDEFVVVCERLDSEGAEATARRIQEKVTSPVRLSGFDLATTVSVGWATSERGRRDLDSVWVEADEAMYESKKLNRDFPPRIVRTGGPALRAAGANRRHRPHLGLVK